MFDKQFLKETYLSFFKDRYYPGKMKECESVLFQWKTWKNKIEQGTLTLDEYVNRRGKKDDYLIYFLNNTTSVYGRSREGNAHQWMVKLNDDGNTYYTASYSNKNGQLMRENACAARIEAEQLYLDKILPLLKELLISCRGINDLKEFAKSEQYEWFRCEQMLEKMMVLESVSEDCISDIKYCLPNFYKKDTIDKLYEEYFELSGEETRVGKSYEIMKKSYEFLDIPPDQRTAATQLEVSRMLWDLVASSSFEVSEDSPNVIFYGSPGTGKTYAVKKALSFLTGGDRERAVFVQCHPGFGYEDFIEGLKPVGITDNGNIRLEIVNGVFKDLCIKAKQDPGKEYYFVADEINRANLSAMFGEALSLLETDYRDKVGSKKEERNLVKTPMSKLIEQQIEEKKLDGKDIEKIAYEYNKNEGVSFGIPSNIRFIGMMNDIDKSIDAFDLALRRRFKWIRKDCDYEVIFDELSGKYDEEEVVLYVDRCMALNDYIARKDRDGLGFGRSYEFGHAYYLKIKSRGNSITKKAYESLFEEHLKPVLTEYIRSYMDESEIDSVLKKAKEIFME